MISELDARYLHEALALAARAVGLTEPNPRVGCVIASSDGQVVGRGHTQRAGEAHAEVMALRDADANGADVTGGTAWVTMEPCSHQGRTPPCADALVARRLSRVVVAATDPNPRVDGAGIARLRAAGIVVELASAQLAADAVELNIGFYSRMRRGRPWVRLKMAASLDGRTALPDGLSQWITGAMARADGHAWRRRAGAILTGSGTVAADDPRLDVRLVDTTVQPSRVVVLGGRHPLSPTARVLQPPGSVLVVTASPRPDLDSVRHVAGAEWMTMPGVDDRVDLAGLVDQLASRGVNELHVEAGAVLNGALLRADLVDEILLYQAPMLLGPGRALAELPLLSGLDQSQRWRYVEASRVGDDLRLRLRRASTGFDPLLA
ncbi:MAG: bifunctional diaminohydroxyphosphoribosylaminopyrimidine deaminase/5-amino-6-(5-phosphoribosylamino)uracil reductase RibD [Aquabacterium sp.]